MNWGCTARVGQMLICNALSRHLMIEDKGFSFSNLKQFEEFQLFEKMSLNYIKQNPKKWEIFLNILC